MGSTIAGSINAGWILDRKGMIYLLINGYL
jgi:hypothetical protein